MLSTAVHFFVAPKLSRYDLPTAIDGFIFPVASSSTPAYCLPTLPVPKYLNILKVCYHLLKTNKSIHPKRPFKITSPPTTSQKNIGQFLLNIALVPLTRIPKFIWKIPKITDIFILTALEKASLPEDIPQA